MSFEKGNSWREDIEKKENGKRFSCLSTFDLEIIPKFLELCAEGKSYNQCSRLLGIPISTFYTWRRNHPEFNRAWEDGRALAMSKWEDIIEENVIDYEIKGEPKKIVRESFVLYTMRARFKQKEESDAQDKKEDQDREEMLANLNEETKKYMDGET